VKLLLDENISYRIKRPLNAAFPGTLHVTDISPGLQGDSAIWDHARDHQFTLVTFDTDFIQLAALRGAPPKVLLLTLRNPRHSAIGSLLVLRKDQIAAFVNDTDEGSPAVMELR
jgi:predicted nuclease of predicted toxin-antitoxin system